MTGNKGEWSELYAFLQLLGKGEIKSADGKLNPIEDKTYPIHTIFRDDSPQRIAYNVDNLNRQILVAGRQCNITLPQQIFSEQASQLLPFIKNLSQGEENPQLEEFLRSIEVDSIKAKSSDKADIRLVVHDIRTGANPELGYSIKSRLGGHATLINACGDGSNLRFKISGVNLDTVKAFNSEKLFKRKFEILRSAHAKILFDKVVSPHFKANLVMLDTCMPRIIACCLLHYYMGTDKELAAITKILEQRNPLRFDLETQPLMYEYKIKQLLLAFALGMTPATVWNGKFNANGGYIVVKEDGDVVCYHFFDRNDLEDYLFHNSYFDTPSTTRHKFGQIEADENGDLWLKLNLQVRFR